MVWAECECFHQKCLPLPSFSSSVDFTSISQFRQEYKDLLEDKDEEAVIEELMNIVNERKRRTRKSMEIRKTVLEAYTPVYKEFFNTSDVTTELIKKKPTKIKDDVFFLPLLTESTCEKILEEMARFHSSMLPSSPPTPPHTKGYFLYELGMDLLVESLRQRLDKVARRLFPSLVGSSGLDSCRAFTVHYDAEASDGDKERGTHCDNSEVSANICLTSSHTGGELYLLGQDGEAAGDLTLQHRQGWAIIHPGRTLHGALPITSGSRTNLLLFLRSSSVRNKLCPVCASPPSLRPVEDGTGDGFTMQVDSSR